MAVVSAEERAGLSEQTGGLAERASRAIAEMYTDWGPGPLPWAMAERYVTAALEFAIAEERRAIVASLVKQYGASCRLTGGLFTGEAFLRAIESIEQGKHVEAHQ